MKNGLASLLSVFLIAPAFADVQVEPMLNRVALQLSAEQWVTTKSALVTIGMNAGVTDSDLGKLQSHLMDKLNQLVKVDWHIVSFSRSMDQSGLERVQASAVARIPDASLAGLRDKTKALSKPGETFTLDDVQFTPSEDEIRSANTSLRENIYQQAKTEIDQLNKMYPDQKYYLHNIDFAGQLMPLPMVQAQNETFMKMSANSAAAALVVGDKLKVSATVVLASAPSADVVKLIHS